MKQGTHYWLTFLSVLSTLFVADGWSLNPFFRTITRTTPADETTHDIEYDMIVIGAGASGLFASGACSSIFGSKTLLIDQVISSTRNSRNSSSANSDRDIGNNLGGDCTNSACVPSKAVRSVAKVASNRLRTGIHNDDLSSVWLSMAQQHLLSTVKKVRQREDPLDMVKRNPNLDIVFVLENCCEFLSSHCVKLTPSQTYSSSRALANVTNQEGSITVKSKQFLIATGASPVIPQHLKDAATKVDIPIFTYRDVFQSSYDEVGSSSIWNLCRESSNGTKRIVIAGGGATACEVGQSLVRLGRKCIEIILVAPNLLPGDDVTLQQAAARLLSTDGVTILLENRIEDILPNRQVMLSNGTLLSPVDGLVLCVGRKPSLESLNLKAADVTWDPTYGVLVNPKTLRSLSARHVFASGDCCSAVSKNSQSRTSTHAGWTGFHAVRNAKLPIFRGGATHPTVPRVIYTDPELAMVGLSRVECIQKYGANGFDFFHVPEFGTDRGDMDCMERQTIGFVEIRSKKSGGKILGFTGCGPAASELANEISVAIVNDLSVLDVARALHSYPSHGYLLHRVALALALDNIWGVIGSCGPVGYHFGRLGQVVTKIIPKKSWLKHFQLKNKLRRRWEAIGAATSLDFGNFQFMSFLDVYNNASLCEEIMKDAEINETLNYTTVNANAAQTFAAWLSEKP